jgi:hypothetical protein
MGWIILAFIVGLVVGFVAGYLVVNIAAMNAIGRHFGW